MFMRLAIAASVALFIIDGAIERGRDAAALAHAMQQGAPIAGPASDDIGRLIEQLRSNGK